MFDLLGAASYAIYLVHFPVISLMTKIGMQIANRVQLPALVFSLAIFAISVAAGILLHLFVEKPLMALINQGRQKESPKPSSNAFPIAHEVVGK